MAVPLKGKRIHFKTTEEKRDYYKAQVEYLKKEVSKSVNGGALKYTVRYHIIELLKGKYPVMWLTKFAGVRRSSYCKWIYKRDEKHTNGIRETIKKGNTIYSRKAQGIWLSTYENCFTGRGIFYKSQKSISLNERAQHVIYYSKEASLLSKGTISMF
ncbi:hypothetical protein ACPA2L_32205 [Bacillus bombysepticus]